MPYKHLPITYVTDEQECHVCTSHRPNNKGYPRIKIDKNLMFLSKYIWETYNGREVPQGMFIRHTCDNRMCINPQHLLIGTIADNNKDMTERGRFMWKSKSDYPRVWGEQVYNHKLNEEAVKEILNSKESYPILAKKFGVSISLISLVKRRKVWKHVKV